VTHKSVKTAGTTTATGFKLADGSDLAALISGKADVVTVSGTVTTSGTSPVTIPLPSGYTRAQCKYAIWVIYGYASNLTVNQSTGAVTAYIESDGGDGAIYYSGRNIGYLCIGVK
jgi:hypothetical protein